MEPTDVTVKILTDIRDEMRQNTAEIRNNSQRIDALGEGLGRRIVESELRTATAITELAGAVRGISTMLSEQLDLRARVDRCERDIDLLKAAR